MKTFKNRTINITINFMRITNYKSNSHNHNNNKSKYNLINNPNHGTQSVTSA